MSDLTIEQLKALAPTGKTAIIKNTVTAFNTYAEEYGINTPLRKAHFLAQLAHESAHFQTTVEYGGKNARYAPWYGRGLIQVTWEENYRAFYKWAQEKGLNPPDFTSAEGREQAARFPWAFLGAVWYWSAHRLNELADRDDVRAITKKINGGYNGLDDRIKYLAAAKKIFGATSTGSPAPTGHSVLKIQNALIKLGYKITADGQMGPATRAAIKMFQKSYGLTADGVVGPKTAEVLFK